MSTASCFPSVSPPTFSFSFFYKIKHTGLVFLFFKPPPCQRSNRHSVPCLGPSAWHPPRQRCTHHRGRHLSSGCLTWRRSTRSVFHLPSGLGDLPPIPAHPSYAFRPFDRASLTSDRSPSNSWSVSNPVRSNHLLRLQLQNLLPATTLRTRYALPTRCRSIKTT